MGTSIDALHLVLKGLLSTEPWLRDPNVVSIPWRTPLVDEILSRAKPDGSASENSPLKLGIYWTDGVVTPQPPIARGLRLVVDAVKAAGHKVPAATRPASIVAESLQHRSLNGILQIS